MYFYSVNLSYLYTFDYEFVSSHKLLHALSVDSQAAFPMSSVIQLRAANITIYFLNCEIKKATKKKLHFY